MRYPAFFLDDRPFIREDWDLPGMRTTCAFLDIRQEFYVNGYLHLLDLLEQHKEARPVLFIDVMMRLPELKGSYGEQGGIRVLGALKPMFPECAIFLGSADYVPRWHEEARRIDTGIVYFQKGEFQRERIIAAELRRHGYKV